MLNPPPTESGKALQQRIAKNPQGRRALREIVLDQHQVLYANDGNTVTLLAIRHGRALGFDVA